MNQLTVDALEGHRSVHHAAAASCGARPADNPDYHNCYHLYLIIHKFSLINHWKMISKIPVTLTVWITDETHKCSGSCRARLLFWLVDDALECAIRAKRHPWCYTSARAAIQHSCNFLTGVVGVNFSGWRGNEKSMVKPFNRLHFLMLSGFDPGCCRGEAS